MLDQVLKTCRMRASLTENGSEIIKSATLTKQLILNLKKFEIKY